MSVRIFATTFVLVSICRDLQNQFSVCLSLEIYFPLIRYYEILMKYQDYDGPSMKKRRNHPDVANVAERYEKFQHD